MDPLTAFVVSALGSVALDALSSRSSLRSFYENSSDGTLTPYHGWVGIQGRGVEWYVPSGLAVVLPYRMVRPIDGNIFDSSKLGAVASSIRRAANRGERVPLYAGYGQVYQIDSQFVAESLCYGDGAPFTTGDTRLDDWLKRKNLGETTPKEDVAFERILKRAVDLRQGDLGQFAATVRDGNHRTFGAILGGEQEVAIRLYDNDIEEVREALRSPDSCHPNRRKFLLSLLRKAIEDTGGMPYWIGPREHSVLFGVIGRQQKRLPSQKPYVYLESCIDSDGDSIRKMVDASTRVSYRTMLENCDLVSWAKLKGYDASASSGRGMTLKSDPRVSYYKSVYRKLPCYFLKWSGIEFIWVPRR